MSAARPAVAFVVAHPDDVAFFMGGTALLLSRRYDLHVICASRGERGYPWTGQGMPPPNEEVARTREAEEREACAMIGAQLTFLGLIDGEIYAEREPIERVAGILHELRPAAVFTHSPHSKSDHAAAYLIALQALQRSELYWHAELYMATQDAMHPRADLFVNVSSVIARKRELIACHRSHHRTPTSIDEWIAQDARFGKLAWCDYAEPYETGLPLMARRWNRKAGSILMELDA